VGEHAGAWSPVLFCGVWAAFVGLGARGVGATGEAHGRWHSGWYPSVLPRPESVDAAETDEPAMDEIGYAAGIIALAGIPT